MPLSPVALNWWFREFGSWAKADPLQWQRAERSMFNFDADMPEEVREPIKTHCATTTPKGLYLRSWHS